MELFSNTKSEKYLIYKVWSANFPYVGLVSPEDIEILLSSKHELEKSRVYKWLEAWLGTELLTSKGILQEFAKAIIEQSKILVEKFKEKCDKPYTIIDPIITQFTLHTICETAMGTRLDETQKVVKNYVSAVYDIGQLILERSKQPWLSINWIYYFPSTKRQEEKLVKILKNFTLSVINNRIVELEKNNNEEIGKAAQIDDEGIREKVDTFMFEGHETTSSGLTYALLQLSNYQHI
ncbi:hypothetical protein FQA39_LY10233 [Lamprigera yunnana]|nr:hypothetical protein FQA39_LY10233 [Lamprigera yunnana]